MAGVALHQVRASFASQAESVTMISPLYQRRGLQETGQIELLPNPDFVFPARLPEHSPSFHDWNALDRRTPPIQTPPTVPLPNGVAHRRKRSSVNALPNFSFDPSATTFSTASPQSITPPHSPNLLDATTPSRGIGHKRGGSEFIGGDGKSGTGLISTSPKKGDMSPPLSALGRLGPPSGGSGHRHRRSGAISCHDLQSILQLKDANSQTRGGSAPVTPLESDQKQFFPSDQRDWTHSQAERRPSLEQSKSADAHPQTRAIPRVRVGFADRVEYIRPLSTISSETESSMSTIRGGHSVSESMSSMISAGASSPSTSRMARPSLDTTFEVDDAQPRPKSCGDVFDSMSIRPDPFDVGTDARLRPQSAVASSARVDSPAMPNSPESPKRKSFSWWDSKRQQTCQFPASVSEPSLVSSSPSSPSSIQTSAFSVGEEPNGVDAEKGLRKPRKVKHWAHSFLSRKAKSHSNLKAKLAEERAQTLSAFDDTLRSPNGETFHFSTTDFEPNFDVDDTITIVTDPQPRLIKPQCKSREHANSDSVSPVIDLDAALVPFKSPALGTNVRSGPILSPPRARRSMHSLGSYGSLSHNHRRTESAPELDILDLRNAKIVPASVMPDVFEEEDEEESTEIADGTNALISSDTACPNSGKIREEGIENHAGEEEEGGARGEAEGFGHRADPTVVDILDDGRPVRASWESETGLGMQRKVLSAPTPTTKLAASRACFKLDDHLTRSATPRILRREPSPVEVVEDFEEPRASSQTQDSDSTITPPSTAEDGMKTEYLDFSLPISQHSIMTPETLSGSSFSSPTFNTSQVSLSAPRLDSATSSGADGRSFILGEPGPAVRMSCDDVPSLSSSRSTMTTPLHNPLPIPGWRFSDEGASSVHLAPGTFHGRGNKRASIASLSRLVGSTFGEKSKLSIESRPQSQHMSLHKGNEQKRTNRLSKLIHFWRKPSDSTRL